MQSDNQIQEEQQHNDVDIEVAHDKNADNIDNHKQGEAYEEKNDEILQLRNNFNNNDDDSNEKRKRKANGKGTGYMYKILFDVFLLLFTTASRILKIGNEHSSRLFNILQQRYYHQGRKRRDSSDGSDLNKRNAHTNYSSNNSRDPKWVSVFIFTMIFLYFGYSIVNWILFDSMEEDNASVILLDSVKSNAFTDDELVADTEDISAFLPSKPKASSTTITASANEESDPDGFDDTAFASPDGNQMAYKNGKDYRTLLERFFKKHNPSKLSTIDEALKRYAGKEDEMEAKLREKYGVGLDDDLEGNAIVSNVQHRLQQQRETFQQNLNYKPVLRTVNSNNNENNNNELEQKITEEIEESDPIDVAELFSDEQHGDDDKINTNSDVFSEMRFDEFKSNANSGDNKITDNVKSIVIGMPFTGSNQLRDFFVKALKIKSSSDDEALLKLGSALHTVSSIPNFNVFDDKEAIFGLLSSFFFEELIAVYPNAKIIITVRNIDDWWNEMNNFVQSKLLPGLSQGFQKCSGGELCETRLKATETLFHVIFGGSKPNEYLWKKRYHEFYEYAFAIVPRSKRMVINLYEPIRDNIDIWESVSLFVLSKLRKDWSSGWSEIKLPLDSKSTGNAVRDAPDYLTKSYHIPKWIEAIQPQQAGQIQVLGVGLPCTGVHSLGLALRKIGYSTANEIDSEFFKHDKASKSYHCGKHDVSCQISNTLHNVYYSSVVSPTIPNFGFQGILQGIDGASEELLSPFFSEVHLSNPDAKIVLLIRPLDEWWGSVQKSKKVSDVSILPSNVGTKTKHKKHKIYYQLESHPWGDSTLSDFRTTLFGTGYPREYLYKKKYKMFVNMVSNVIPQDRLLLLNVKDPDAWTRLCYFVHKTGCTTKLMQSPFPSSSLDC